MFYRIITLIMLSVPGILFAQKERPNIIFIITDDQHRDQFNFLEEGRDSNDAPKNLTPNIDRLAREGVILDECYVSTSVCTPSRYGILTGNYASRANNSGFLEDASKYNQTNVHWNVDIIETTSNIASVMSKQGYFTGGVGKNHVIAAERGKKVSVDADPNNPDVKAKLVYNQKIQQQAYKSVGFDYASNIYKGNLPTSYPKALEDHNMDWVVNGALNFLDLAAERKAPFFLYFATTLQHGPDKLGTKCHGNPLATPVGFLDKPLKVMPSRESIDERIEAAGLAADRNDILWLDDGIGAIIKKLGKIGKLENTVIFFMDDHGVEGGKGSLYQGGVKTVGFVWGPKYIDSGIRSKQMVSNIDFVPTVFDLCKITPPKQYHLDGVSILPILSGEDKPVHQSLFFEIGATRGVLMDGMKYIAFRTPPEKLPTLEIDGKFASHINDRPGGRGSESPALAKYPYYFDHDQLYNVENDPNEQVNLYDKYENDPVVAKLKAELESYLEELPGGFAEFK